jgi:acetylornithine deacetylase/succinyl-diaminopimelate desuccinylase-like protein
MNDIMQRMTRAAQRGADSYLSLIGQEGRGSEAVRISYDKLHNDAYGGDPDSPTMRDAITAARECGMWHNEPIMGWTVSCDARLFATACPQKTLITTGAGKLEHAHSDNEQLLLDDLVRSVEFLVLYILRETGTGHRKP